MSTATPILASPNVCRILSLDGGGAKGFYTLGVLKQVEAMLGGQPLCKHFNLIFGTSTGAIIAALLALGHQVEAILELYKKHVPAITGKLLTSGRTKALAELVEKVFGKADFTQVKTGVGIVATHWIQEKPMIFKGDVAQAHGSKATFVPGFGCTIADAVRASCSAFPYFKRATVKTSQGADVELFDGGYCANNPTLYAIADAVKALQTHGANANAKEPIKGQVAFMWTASELVAEDQLLQLIDYIKSTGKKIEKSALKVAGKRVGLR